MCSKWMFMLKRAARILLHFSHLTFTLCWVTWKQERERERENTRSFCLCWIHSSQEKMESVSERGNEETVLREERRVGERGKGWNGIWKCNAMEWMVTWAYGMEYGMETEWILLWFWGTFNALLSYFYCYFHCYVLTFSLPSKTHLSHSKISIPFLLQQIHSFQEFLLFSYSLSKFKRYRRFYGSVSVWEENRSPHLFCMSHSFYYFSTSKDGKREKRWSPSSIFCNGYPFVCVYFISWKVRKWEGEREEIEVRGKRRDWVWEEGKRLSEEQVWT